VAATTPSTHTILCRTGLELFTPLCDQTTYHAAHSLCRMLLLLLLLHAKPTISMLQ
jgi:hypothetical protein